MPGPRAAKKSSTPTKSAPAAKAKGQKYEYTELAKVSLTNSDPHNVYGIIIDATFPHKVSADKYVCSLKIVDPSLHSKGGKATDNDYATVVIYAKRFEDLPIANKVGDIIRLHRATLRMYKNQRQFNVSTQWNGSWAVFSTEDNNFAPVFQNMPYQVTIQENHPASSSVFKTTAIDADATVRFKNEGLALS